MEPTLLIGDHILIDQRQSARNPHRGDLIVFEFPEDAEKEFFKRVAATEGESAIIGNKKLSINDKAVRELQIIHRDLKILPPDQFTYSDL